MKIDLATKPDLADFFTYITRQLADNGRANTPLFQPVSRDESVLSVPSRQRFMQGINTPMGQPGWRLLWLAKDELGHIMGHIDIRPHEDDYCEHRVLLGMGVDSHFRRQGVGRKLIEHCLQYCRSNPQLSWLDLNVLSNNFAAKQLYLNAGFTVCGELVDRYRIDGESVSELTMSINIQLMPPS